MTMLTTEGLEFSLNQGDAGQNQSNNCGNEPNF
jgi:hypothetical protein